MYVISRTAKNSYEFNILPDYLNQIKDIKCHKPNPNTIEIQMFKPRALDIVCLILKSLKLESD